MARAINQAGLDLVKSFEGFRPQAYRCPAGVWTIGYGHIADVQEGQQVTLDEAEDLLEKDMAGSASDVEKAITVPLNDNQFAALVSFTFNVGAGNLRESTLRKKLNSNDYDAVPSELSRWVKATNPATGEKQTLRGLVRRRAAEGDLWLTPIGPGGFADTRQMPQAVHET